MRPRREKTCLLGFRQSESRYDSSPNPPPPPKKKKKKKTTTTTTDNIVADETARIRRLVCASVVTNHQRQVFSVAVELLYLRNKETQQTLRVFVNIQYDASF